RGPGRVAWPSVPAVVPAVPVDGRSRHWRLTETCLGADAAVATKFSSEPRVHEIKAISGEWLRATLKSFTGGDFAALPAIGDDAFSAKPCHGCARAGRARRRASPDPFRQEDNDVVVSVPSRSRGFCFVVRLRQGIEPWHRRVGARRGRVG